MKCTILLFFCVYAQLIFAQQEFIVLATKGTIIKSPSNQVLKPGDKIKGIDHLIFGSPDAAAEVISRTEGRRVLKQKKQVSSDIFKKFEVLVQDYLQLSKGYMDSRGGDLCSKIDFQNYFSRDTLLIIGDTCAITICKNSFLMSDTTFFYIEYKYQGKLIAKKLEYDKDKLKLIRSKLFIAKDSTIDKDKVSDYTLYFYHVNNSQSEEICNLNPCFISGSELKQTIETYLTCLKNEKLTQNDNESEIKSLIYDLYGIPDKEVLTDWLEKNIKL